MRKDQHKVTVTLDGKNLGVFDVMTGGEGDTTELNYKPGGMGAQISLGGIPTLGQVIVNRLYDLQRDHTQIHWIMSRVGKGHMVVKKMVLDPDGNNFGQPLTYQGTLKRCTPTEVDSNATDAALLELELTPTGTVT
jgi:hypothetical protein